VTELKIILKIEFKIFSKENASIKTNIVLNIKIDINIYFKKDQELLNLFNSDSFMDGWFIDNFISCGLRKAIKVAAEAFIPNVPIDKSTIKPRTKPIIGKIALHILNGKIKIASI